MNFWNVVPVLLAAVVLTGLVLFTWTTWKLYGTTPAALGTVMIDNSKWFYIGSAATHIVSLVLAGFVAMQFKKK